MTGLFVLDTYGFMFIAFIASLLISLGLTPWVIRASFRIDAVDRPDARKVHKKPISRLGGVSMMAGLAVPLLLYHAIDRTMAGFLGGAAIAVLTGFLDDVYRIPPRFKFLGEIAAAVFFTCVAGMALPGFGDVLGIGKIRLGVIALPVTVFCMVGVMNAMNLSDGLDGLAGGISAITCIFLAGFAFLSRAWHPLVILVALFGSVLGFLRYNTYPARLFMGDSGSLLLGYTLSAVAVMLVQKGGSSVPLAPVTVAAVLSLPIMDTLVVMARRARLRGNPFSPDRTHLHHRLLDLGLPHAVVVPVIHLGAAGFAFQAFALRSRPEWVQFAAVLALGTAIYGLVSLCHGRLSVLPGYIKKERPRTAAGILVRTAFLLRRTERIVAWIIVIGMFLPIAVIDSVSGRYLSAAVISAVFLPVLHPWRSINFRSPVRYGIVYIGFVLLLSFQQFNLRTTGWIAGYHAGLCLFVVFWVMLNFCFRRHRYIFFPSGYEALFIGGTFASSLILLPALGVGNDIGRTMLVICLESVSLLMAVNILIRRRPVRARLVAIGFLLALSVIQTPRAVSESHISGPRNGPSTVRVEAIHYQEAPP